MPGVMPTCYLLIAGRGKEIMMKKVSLLSVLVFFIMVSISCGQKLTDNLAMELIRKGYGYPIPVAINLDFKKNSPIAQEISRLVADGYMSPQKSYLESYKITEKGKNLVKFCYWNSSWDAYDFSPFTHNKDVVKIKKILTDSKSGTATVTYEYGFIPNPYFDKLISLDKEVVDKAVKNLRSGENTSYFKKYDQGWQFER